MAAKPTILTRLPGILAILSIASAHAATRTVPGQYATIGAAITAAQASDVIVVAAGNYRENVVAGQSVTIQGAGNGLTIIDGGNIDSTVTVLPGYSVIINDVKITRGVGGGALGAGGGVFNEGTLLIQRCIIDKNNARSSGAGISNYNGDMTLVDCTISNNAANDAGAGIENEANLTMSNCLVDANVTGGGSRGIGGGVVNAGTLNATNCTFYNNRADQGGAIYNNAGTSTLESCTLFKNTAATSGGGIVNLATVIAHNTIIAAGSSGSGAGPDIDGALSSLGHNLIGNNKDASITAVGGASGDKIGTSAANLDPKLQSSLANNGGPTLTLLPLAGSPCIDSGDPASYPATDQRGAPRPQDGDANGTALPDIGAVELAATYVVTNTTLVSTISATLNATIDRGGMATTAQFQTKSGTTYTNVGSQIALTAGGVTNVSLPASGLTAGSQYTYRVVATNSVATVNGADSVFVTLTPSSGDALLLDGLTGVATIQHDAAYNAYPLTVSAWIKTSNTNPNAGLVSKYTNSSFNGWQLAMFGNSIHAWYIRDASNRVFNAPTLGLNGGNVADNNWHHVAFTVDSAGGKLYVDGALKDSLPWTGAAGPVTTTNPIRIGNYDGVDVSAGSNYAGIVDEVRVYNAALSLGQIQAAMSKRLTGTEANLVADYRLDEGAGTVAGNSGPLGGSATISGGASWVTSTAFDDRTPVSGSALSFNGSNQYVQATNGVYFNGDFTVEGWVYPRSFASWSRLLDFGNGAGTDNVLLAITNGTTGYPALSVYSNGTPGDIVSPVAIQLNRWTHLAVTLQGTTATLYINGQPVVSGATNTPRNVLRTQCYIGRSNWPSDALSDAVFDEIRIWNKARTQQDIQATLYRTLTGAESGLIAYYPMDEDAGPAANDWSGHGATAYLNGPPVWQPSTAPIGPPIATADVARALKIAGGLITAGPSDPRLNVVPNAGIDLNDAARLARRAAGLDPNP